jgi:fucose 4-O-acetylase-like acetyltransferase
MYDYFAFWFVFKSYLVFSYAVVFLYFRDVFRESSDYKTVIKRNAKRLLLSYYVTLIFVAVIDVIVNRLNIKETAKWIAGILYGSTGYVPFHVMGSLWFLPTMFLVRNTYNFMQLYIPFK